MTTHQEVLLPCPFCGSPADLSEDTDSWPRSWTAFCTSCDSCTCNCEEPAETVERWNRRAALSSTPATVPQGVVARIKGWTDHDGHREYWLEWSRDSGNLPIGTKLAVAVPHDVGVPEGQPLTRNEVSGLMDKHAITGVHIDSVVALVRDVEAEHGVRAATPNPPTAQAETRTQTIITERDAHPNAFVQIPKGTEVKVTWPPIQLAEAMGSVRSQPEAGVQGGQTDNDKTIAYLAGFADGKKAAQPERVALTPEQRRKIIVNAHDVGHAIDMVETAHGIGSTPGTGEA